jgi:aryl-alcohol dehydrogenase-like predicted oxidoreductase
LEITPIGIGAWAMGGGDWAFSWGRQEDDQSIAAIHAALDAGVNWIDTAAVYGLGHSEEVVGKAIAGRTHRPYVFTKCSLVWNDQGEIGHSLKAASVRRELEASLQRLRVDVIGADHPQTGESAVECSSPVDALRASALSPE